MKQEQTYFYVYNPKEGKPTYKHDNFESAKKEAQRLAETCNDEFLVLAVCYSVKKIAFAETEYSLLPF